MLNYDWDAAKRVFYKLTATQMTWLNKMIERERRAMRRQEDSQYRSIKRRRYL